MKKENKRKYSTLSNYRFLYGELWRYDKKICFYSLAEVMVKVLVSFGMVLLPSLIIGMLERGIPMAALAGKTLLLFTCYGIISGLGTYLDRRNEFQFIEFRGGHMMPWALRKVIDLDYMQYEDEKNQQLLNKGREAFWGNHWGLEGILHDDVAALTGILGLLLYAFLISEVSPWIVIMLFMISLIQIGSFQIANKYELKNKEEKAKLEVTQNYLDRQAYEVSVGKDIRLYQLQGWLSGLYRRANKKYQRIIAKERSCYFANDLFGLFLQLGRDIVCYGYLIHRLQGGMAVSRFVLYIGVVAGFSVYFSQITTKVSEIGRFQRLVDFLREFLDIPRVFHHGEGLILDREENTIEVEFSHVTFCYPDSEQKILDDISFVMKRGEKMALVGINGAGKTTIVKLICGFYKPLSGHIYLNGVDIEDLDLDEYYKDLAVVFQDSFTYSYSIAENVCCCTEEEYDRERCLRALERAGLWEKVRQLPKEEKTCLNKDVEPDGIQLSGGERQKLMLARALYKNGRLLLLDEPTAALDAIAENEMYERYHELICHKTALFISHRLASTRFCDKILFLENGRIAESGTHEELMKRQGKYAYMFEVQSQYYREGGNEDETAQALA